MTDICFGCTAQNDLCPITDNHWEIIYFVMPPSYCEEIDKACPFTKRKLCMECVHIVKNISGFQTTALASLNYMLEVYRQFDRESSCRHGISTPDKDENTSKIKQEKPEESSNKDGNKTNNEVVQIKQEEPEVQQDSVDLADINEETEVKLEAEDISTDEEIIFVVEDTYESMDADIKSEPDYLSNCENDAARIAACESMDAEIKSEPDFLSNCENYTAKRSRQKEITTLGDLAKLPPDDSDKEIFQSFVIAIDRNFPPDWRSWEVPNWSENDNADDLEAKLKFGPSTDVIKLLQPNSKVKESDYRMLRKKLASWPLGQALIKAPAEVLNRIKEHSSEQLKEASSLLKSVVEKNKEYGVNATKLFHQELPMNSNLMLADILNLQKEFFKKIMDNQIEFKKSIDILTEMKSKANSDSESSDDEKIVYREAESAVVQQAAECHRISTDRWERITNDEVKIKFEVSPFFCGLQPNPTLQRVSIDRRLSRALIKFDRALGSISYGLLLQRMIFSALIKHLPETARAQVAQIFLVKESLFRRHADDLLQYVCGFRTKVFQMRRKLYKPKYNSIISSLYSIPPTQMYLFDDVQLKEVIRRFGGTNNVFKMQDKKRNKDKNRNKRRKVN